MSAAEVSGRVGGGEQGAAYAGDGLVLAVVLLRGDEGHEPFKGAGVALQSRLHPSVSGKSGAGVQRRSDAAYLEIVRHGGEKVEASGRWV